MRKEMEDTRQNQVELLEMKNLIPEMKFSLYRVNSKLVPVLEKERPVNLSQQKKLYKNEAQREK